MYIYFNITEILKRHGEHLIVTAEYLPDWQVMFNYLIIQVDICNKMYLLKEKI